MSSDIDVKSLCLSLSFTFFSYNLCHSHSLISVVLCRTPLCSRHVQSCLVTVSDLFFHHFFPVYMPSSSSLSSFSIYIAPNHNRALFTIEHVLTSLYRDSTFTHQYNLGTAAKSKIPLMERYLKHDWAVGEQPPAFTGTLSLH